MKIAVIGGGSTYTPELINGFLERISSLPISELWLMDIDLDRLAIVGGFAKRMQHAARGAASGTTHRIASSLVETISSTSPCCGLADFRLAEL